MYYNTQSLCEQIRCVDEFVLKYTGEDLRKAVVNEIKWHHNAKVKAFISRMTNASARATEKAKTYDDFDWENLIRTNELRNLYVSQLDLHLLRNLKLSHKDCETQANKIEEIKKHLHSSQSKESFGREQGPQQAAHQKINVALDQKSKSNGTPAMLNVLPWGSTMMVPHQGQLILVNTCPIDNFLMIFYVLMKKHSNFLKYLLTSPEPYSTTLNRIGHMFDNGNFAEGKCEWMKLFPGRFNFTHTAQVDLWGNEEDLFMSRLYSSLETAFTSNCQLPIVQLESRLLFSFKAITLR